MIFENEDDLGYFTDQEMAKASRRQPLIPDTLILCNAMLSREEQAEIAQAAHLAANGYALQAEQHRTVAGYGYRVMKSRPDTVR